MNSLFRWFYLNLVKLQAHVGGDVENSLLIFRGVFWLLSYSELSAVFHLFLISLCLTEMFIRVAAVAEFVKNKSHFQHENS